MTPDNPDPTVLEKLYHSGAWVPLGILLAFFGLRAAKSRIVWLQEDHRAVWASAILGGLATLIVPATQGTTPNLAMIIGAIVTVASLHADPKKTPAEQKQTQAGFARLGLMVVIAMLGAMLLFGCGGANHQKSLGYATATLDAVQITIDTYDTKHIAQIASSGTSRADIDAKTAAWLADFDKAKASLRAARLVIVDGYKLDTDASITNAETAAADVLALITSLGVK